MDLELFTCQDQLSAPPPPSPMCQLLTFPPELAMASLRQPLPGHEPYNACWELGCCQNNQGVNNASLECSTREQITLFQGASLEKGDCGCFGFNFQPFTTFSDAAHEVSVLSGNESSVSPPMDVFLGAVHVQQVVMNDHWRVGDSLGGVGYSQEAGLG